MYLKELENNEKIFDHEIINFYKKILNGEEQRFPQGTWDKPDSIYYGTTIVKYLFEQLLNWTVEDLKTRNFRQIFLKYKLTGMYQKVFNSSPWSVVENTYGYLFHPWEMNQCPMSFWKNKDNRIKAIKWLTEEQLNIKTIQDVRKKLRVRTIRKYGLSSLLTNIYKDDLFKFFKEAYPDWEIKRWELGKVPIGYWNDEDNVKEAMEWLVFEKLKITKKEAKEKLNYTMLENYNLDGLYILNNYSIERLLSFI